MAELIRTASAGSEDSGDVQVTVSPAQELRLQITSTLCAQFGEAIERTARQVLAERKIAAGEIRIADKGALDWILRARLEAALMQAEEAAV